MSCREGRARASGRPPVAVLVVTLGGLMFIPCAAQSDEPESSGRSGRRAADVVTHPLRFSADLTGELSHREDIRLVPGSGSGDTARVGADMTWSLVNTRTSFFASLSPYYERFRDQGDLSTYGGSGGLGVRRRVSSRLAWGISGRLEAAPEQDLPPAATSPDPADPQVRVLVPRNGFIRLMLDADVEQTISATDSLVWSLSSEIARYDTYDVEDGTAVQPLTDSDRIDVGAAWSHQTSPRHTLSVTGEAGFFSLDRDPSSMISREEDRERLTLGVQSSHQISSRSSLSYGGGVSRIESADGDTATEPVFDAGWDFGGRKIQSAVQVTRSQEVFRASQTSVDSTSVAGRLGWRPTRRSQLSVSAGFGISEAAGDAPGASGDSRTRSLTGDYRRSVGRTLSWSVSVSHDRQRSDAGFADDLETTTVAAGIAWRIAGPKDSRS